ncbi:MAG: helix-turn-helix transcriptional regulator [Coriobacteriales bacterium]|nr:helix-turn-helix transcriptional regulator [Coriobacteriales bacterium]
MHDESYNSLPMALGIGFGLLWMMMGAFSHQIAHTNAIEFSGWIVTVTSAGVTFLCLSFVYKRYPKALSLRMLVILAALFGFVGVLCVSLGINVFGKLRPLITAGDITSGCGIALSFALIHSILLHVNNQYSQEQICVAALIMAVLLYLLLLNVDIRLLAAVCIAAPVVSAALLLYSVGGQTDTVQQVTALEQPYLAEKYLHIENNDFRTKLLLLTAPIVLLSMLDGLYLAGRSGNTYITIDSSVVASAVLATIFIALALAGLLIRPHIGIRFGSALLILAILTAVVHLLCEGHLHWVTVTMRFLLNFIYLLYLLIEINSLPVTKRLLCLVSCCVILGLLAGLILAAWPDYLVGLKIILLVAVAILAVLGIRIKPDDLSRFAAYDNYQAEIVQTSKKPAVVQQSVAHDTAGEDAYFQGIEARCETAAGMWNLSRRESEVLNMLVRGRSANSIAEEMSISYNTVKSHIAHIYTKSDTHTHEELMRLFEELE